MDYLILLAIALSIMLLTFATVLAGAALRFRREAQRVLSESILLREKQGAMLAEIELREGLLLREGTRLLDQRSAGSQHRSHTEAGKSIEETLPNWRPT